MEVDCLSYFFPKNDWKGEYGFDWFRAGIPPKEVINGHGDPAMSNFDNIGALASIDTATVHLKGLFSEESTVFYKREMDYASENAIDLPSEEQEFAKYYLQHTLSQSKWLVVQKGDEFYFYHPVPFVDRRKTVDFDLVHPQSQNKYHYHVDYDGKGKVELLCIARILEEKVAERYEFKEKSELLEPSRLAQLEIDEKLVDRLFENADLIGGDPTLGDPRISEAVIAGSSSEIMITYFDGHQVTYEYQAAELCGVTFDGGQQKPCSFRGSSESVMERVKEAGLNVVEALLTCPFYCQPEQVHALDEGISEVNITMHNAHAVKCTLQIQKEADELYFADLEHNEIKPWPFEVLKVVGGKARIPDRIEDGEVVFADAEFDAVSQKFEEQLVPLWVDYLSETLQMKEYQGKSVYYPIPMLSLVNYRYADKRNGLNNVFAELQVRTLGKFSELFFASSGADEKEKGFIISSTEKSSELLALYIKQGRLGMHLVKAVNQDAVEVGRLGVCIFEPIHLKICFVNVAFGSKGDLMTSSSLRLEGAPGWSFRDDRFIEILGQPGVLFDEIVETDFEVEQVDELWDPNLKTHLMDTSKMDLCTWLDEQFINAHPEFSGYYRVYVLDQYMTECHGRTRMSLITHLLSIKDPLFSPLVIFKKSIEAAGATLSNPLAHGLLRSLGVDLVVNTDKTSGIKLRLLKGTSTNVMDDTEIRYSLTIDQWFAIREKAQLLHEQLEEAQKQANKKKK